MTIYTKAALSLSGGLLTAETVPIPDIGVHPLFLQFGFGGIAAYLLYFVCNTVTKRLDTIAASSEKNTAAIDRNTAAIEKLAR